MAVFQRWKVPIISLLSIALVIVVSLYQRHLAETEATTASQPLSAPSSERPVPSDKVSKTVATEQVLGYVSSEGPLPDSLRDTSLRESFSVDEDGHLRLAKDLRQVFDFFLATIHEESLDKIVARIHEYLDYHLDEPALGEARAAFASYLDLKSALYDLEERNTAVLQDVQLQDGKMDKQRYLAMLENQLAERNQLREMHLSAELHQAFYAEEEVYDQFTLDRMKVVMDPEISAEEKKQRLAQLEAALPEHLVAGRREASVLDTLYEKSESVKAQGGSQQEIRSVRRELFGEEAVARFDKLDQERAAWQARLDEYMRQRDQVLSATGLSQDDREKQITQLRKRLFDEREQIRVISHERWVAQNTSAD